jgi:hypothetical protein
MCRRAYLIQYFGQAFDACVCNHTCDACGLKLPAPLVPVGTGVKPKPVAAPAKPKGPRGPVSTPGPTGLQSTRGTALATKAAIVPSVYNVRPPPAPRPVLLQPTRPPASSITRQPVPAPNTIRAVVPSPSTIPAVMGGRVLPASFRTPTPSPLTQYPAPRTEPVRKRPPPDPSLAQAEFHPVVYTPRAPQHSFPAPSRTGIATSVSQPRAMPALAMEPVKPQKAKGIEEYFRGGAPTPATAPPRKRQKPLDFGEEERF